MQRFAQLLRTGRLGANAQRVAARRGVGATALCAAEPVDADAWTLAYRATVAADDAEILALASPHPGSVDHILALKEKRARPISALLRRWHLTVDQQRTLASFALAPGAADALLTAPSTTEEIRERIARRCSPPKRLTWASQTAALDTASSADLVDHVVESLSRDKKNDIDLASGAGFIAQLAFYRPDTIDMLIDLEDPRVLCGLSAVALTPTSAGAGGQLFEPAEDAARRRVERILASVGKPGDAAWKLAVFNFIERWDTPDDICDQIWAEMPQSTKLSVLEQSISAPPMRTRVASMSTAEDRIMIDRLLYGSRRSASNARPWMLLELTRNPNLDDVSVSLLAIVLSSCNWPGHAGPPVLEVAEFHRRHGIEPVDRHIGYQRVLKERLDASRRAMDATEAFERDAAKHPHALYVHQAPSPIDDPSDIVVEPTKEPPSNALRTFGGRDRQAAGWVQEHLVDTEQAWDTFAGFVEDFTGTLGALVDIVNRVADPALVAV